MLGILVFLCLTYLVIFGRALRQEADHLAIARALPQAIFSAHAIRLDDGTYLAKDTAAFVAEMERQGFIHLDQMGSGHIFEKDRTHYLSTGKMYSRYFMVFTQPKESGLQEL